MAEVMEDREAVKTRRGTPGKVATRAGELPDIGPIDGRTVMFPRQLWKDVSKRAIDEETNASALVVKWVREKMARFGCHYSGGSAPGDVSAVQASEVNNSGEAGPVEESLTPADGEGEGVAVGGGEGQDERPVRSRRNRA